MKWLRLFYGGVLDGRRIWIGKHPTLYIEDGHGWYDEYRWINHTYRFVGKRPNL